MWFRALKGTRAPSDLGRDETGKVRAMTTIRATCAACGDVELTTVDVSVMISRDSGDGTYSFRCPLCETVVVKDCPRHTVDLLISAGVHYAMFVAPDEPVPDPYAPAFTHDDLLEFHAFLANDDQVAGALEALRG